MHRAAEDMKGPDERQLAKWTGVEREGSLVGSRIVWRSRAEPSHVFAGV